MRRLSKNVARVLSFHIFILEIGLFQAYKGKGLSQGSLQLCNTHTTCLTNCGHTHTQILWSTSRHGCYLHCDVPFLPSFPAKTSKKGHSKEGHFLSDIWPLALCSLCFLPSESRYNATALSRCLCICRVLRVRGCRSCKSNMHAIASAAHNTHSLTRLHLTTLGWPCLFTSVYAMSVEWQSGSG